MLPDLLSGKLKAVIVGTAAGTLSASLGYYYAKPTNKFWETLFQVGLTPHKLLPNDYKSLIEYGIGLTDLAKQEAGMDSSLSKKAFDKSSFVEKINNYSPKFVCFNGKRAVQEFLDRKVDYGLQEEAIGSTKLFVAHSTSGANAHWDINSWEGFAALVRRLS